MEPVSLEVEEVAARLRHTLLFDALDGATLRALAGRTRALEVGPGEVVVAAGAEARELYLVADGLLLASRSVDGHEEVLGELHKGGFFGEAALIGEGVRSATVRARSACALLCLSAADVDAVLAPGSPGRLRLDEAVRRRRARRAERRYHPGRDAVHAALAAAFPGLDDAALAALADEVTWSWLPPDAVALRQGDLADGLFVVRDGQLRVFVTRADGTEVTVGAVGTGETLGEAALLADGPRSATAVALCDAELLHLSRATFERLVGRHPSVLRAIAGQIVQRLTDRAGAAGRVRAAPRVTVEACERVVATTDLVLRNLRITQTYHRLAMDLAGLVGAQDVNWCGFGCHASKTAGYAIRREDLPAYELAAALAALPGLGPAVRGAGRAVARLALVEAVVDAVNVASAAVSGGNLRIFGDMAPVFARFLRAFGQDQRYDPARLEAFLAELAPGPSAEGGQDTLASALRRFYEAAFEPDERRRAELILLGNLEVGLHEQIRVQSDIDEALGAPLRRHLGDELGRLLADGRLGPIPAGLRRRLVRRADALEARLDHALARVVRRLLTRHQMALRLPGGAVRLGRDLRGTGRAEAVPGVLRSPEHPELVALLARFDRSAARGTRALDWGSLEDRMNFIAHLFRTRQRDLNLLSAPFTPAQVLEIDAGRVPAGPL